LRSRRVFYLYQPEPSLLERGVVQIKNKNALCAFWVFSIGAGPPFWDQERSE